MSPPPLPPDSPDSEPVEQRSLTSVPGQELAVPRSADADGPGNNGRGERFALGLDVLRGLADQELTRAENARVRSRQAFAFAAGFFVIVQTVSFGAFVTSQAKAGHRTGTLINHATYAAAALAACGLLLLIAELPFRSRDLNPDEVWEMVEGERSDDEVAKEFAHMYGMVVAARRDTNRLRFWFVAATQVAAVVTIGLTLWELLVGLHPGF